MSASTQWQDFDPKQQAGWKDYAPPQEEKAAPTPPNTPSDPRTVWNPRIRNIPDPAANETSALGAFYHGAKAGATLASLPALATTPPAELVLGAVGGTGGAIAGNVAAKSAGLGELGQEMGTDVGGAVGGGLAIKGGNWAAMKAKAVYEALPPAVQKELVGVISPRWGHALKLFDALGIGEAPPAPTPPAPPAAAQAGPVPIARPSVPDAVEMARRGTPAGPGDISAEVQAVRQADIDRRIKFGSAEDRVRAVQENAALAAPEVQDKGFQRSNDLQKRKMAEPRTAAEAPTATRKDLTLTEADFLKARQLQRTNAGASNTTQAAVQQQLSDALGGQPKIQPGVPIRDQLQAAIIAKGELPKGFTAADSGLLKGYKYDPAAQEFTAILKNGQSYTHGEVTPEQFKAFEDADSQGSAWTNKIKQGAGTVLVKKNGRPLFKSVPTEDAPVPPGPQTADMTSLLQESVRRAKKSQR